jgi:hypothetical protein
MRSKWLDWKPNDEIIEKSGRAYPTKPTKPNSVGFEGTAMQGLPIKYDRTWSPTPNATGDSMSASPGHIDNAARRERVRTVVGTLSDPLSGRGP